MKKAIATINKRVDQERKINIRLDEFQYNMALKAHSDSIPISCYGNLIKEGKAWILKDSKNFAFKELI